MDRGYNIRQWSLGSSCDGPRVTQHLPAGAHLVARDLAWFRDLPQPSNTG